MQEHRFAAGFVFRKDKDQLMTCREKEASELVELYDCKNSELVIFPDRIRGLFSHVIFGMQAFRK